MSTNTRQFTIADYLFERVAEAGASDVFGVPGDFNLSFLDNIIASDKLTWVGNTNELNAGYSADGYARERGFAAMVTTFGVGELSAINATAGSYAEYAPVLHIVGAPATDIQDAKSRVHHTLGDGIFNHFISMIEPVTVARAKITPENAASEIDRVIRLILKKHRPGYIMLSPDVAKMPIYPPTTKLMDSDEDITSQEALKDFKHALSRFIEGKTTTLLADMMVHRMGLQPKLKAIIADSTIPYTTLSWGKTLLDENSERWAGIYSGNASSAKTKTAVENCECLIKIGVNYTDTTTAGFSQNINPDNVVDIHYERSSIAGKNYAPIAIKDAMQALHEVLTSGIHIAPMPLENTESSTEYQQQGEDDKLLLQADLWPLLAQHLIKATDIVFADQGTSYFGISEVRLPSGVSFYGQPLWGSIGYTLPACLGAGLASPQKRSILLIGDGSALLTIQEISVMIKKQLNLVIVLVNNEGYTVERAIHGENQPYNDIPNCDWQLMPKAFGATQNNTLILKATTPNELKDTMQTIEQTRDKLVFLEVTTGKHDVPLLLKEVTDALKDK